MSTDTAWTIPEFSRGDRLRKARERTGLGHTEFADELGVSRNTITNYERDHVAPRRTVLLSWAVRTGVPLKWLETGEVPSPDDDPGEGLPNWLRARRDSNPQPSDSEPGEVLPGPWGWDEDEEAAA